MALNCHHARRPVLRPRGPRPRPADRAALLPPGPGVRSHGRRRRAAGAAAPRPADAQPRPAAGARTRRGRRRPGRGPGAGDAVVRARAAPGAVGGVVGGHAGRALERGAAPRGLDDAPRPAPRHRGPPPRRRAELGRQPVGAPAADAAHQPRRHAVAAPRRLGDAARVAGQRAGRRGDGDGSTLPGDLPRPGADRGARRAARACPAGGAGADHLRGAHPDVHLRRHPRGDPRAASASPTSRGCTCASARSSRR